MALSNAGPDHKYAYTADLLALQACINPTPPPLTPALSCITTPLITDNWSAYLAPHSDRDYVQYIINGINNGFRIGFEYSTVKCMSSNSNHPSANDHPAVISTNLQQEVRKGHLVGPLNHSDYPFVHTSSLGAIPKKDCIDKWRLILNLSHPKGASVNDSIARNLCSLSYMKVDDIVQQVLQLGRGALLAKIDIESTFRNIPVHPNDRHLLRMRWCNQLYIDTILPFGLRSAPKNF